MTWVFLVLGLIIGWLLYLLADTFFWRDRRVCTELERELQGSVADLEGQNLVLNNRIGELDVEAGKVPALQAALNARGAELDGLNASLKAKDADIAGYNVRIGDLETVNGSLSGQIGDLEAGLASRDAELINLRGRIGDLEADLSGRDSQIAGLNADLGDLNVRLGERDSEIARLNGQVGSVDSELKGWGLGALAAGGLMALRERFSGMKADLSAKESEIDSMQLNVEDTSLKLGTLTADLETKEAEIGDLNAQLAALHADVDARDIQIGDLNAQIGGLEANVAERDATLAGLQVELEGKDAEIGGLNLQLGDLRGQLADVDNELSGLNIDADAGMAAGAGAGLGLAGLIGWLRGRKDSLEVDVAERDNQLVSLNAQVETDRVGYEQQLGDLNANLETKDVEIGALNAQLASLRADLEGRDAHIEGLNADLNLKSGEIGDLNTQIAGLNVDVDGKNAEIDGLNLQLGDLRGQLADVDNELSGLNVDAAAGAGAGLGLAGLIGWLRSRKDSLETDVAERDNQLVSLNAQVETDRVSYEQRIGGLEARLAELDAKDAEIAGLNAQIAGLNADLDGHSTQIGALNARVGELDAEIAASAEKHSAEVDGVLSDLLERENELALLRGELASVQGELDGLTIDANGGAEGEANVNTAALAGGGLGLAGLVAWLRGRKDSLETDVAARDNQLLSLNAKVETDAKTFELDRGRYSQRISDLEAMLAERDVTIGSLQASLPPDDLTRVWGIGPKIAAALNEYGITTFSQLAETEDDSITEILDASGVNYRLAGPAVRATWQEQAELLAAGELDELKLRQAQFKRSGGGLGKVWGIGSKVTGLLAAAGVANYTDLATSRTSDIGDALHAAKGYYPSMSNAEIHQSWVQQASMAANSQWTQLKSYQARFRRGRASAKPDDLKRIWGIGAKIEEVLNQSDIYTFARLAETSVAEIERILNESGSRFNMTSSDTLLANWTTQARLASVGNWDAFQELYDKLTWENVQDDD